MSHPLEWTSGPRTAVLGALRDGAFVPLADLSRDERERCVRILVELPRDSDIERDAEAYQCALDALAPGWRTED